MDDDSLCSLYKPENFPNYNRLSKKPQVKISPDKLTITGNFTKENHSKDIIISKPVKYRTESTSCGRKEDRHHNTIMHTVDNPVYEDPRDVIGEKPIKPPRRSLQPATLASSPRLKTDKSTLKEIKRKLSKKYDHLIQSLLDKCEENVDLIQQKNMHLQKLTEKLKSVLEYNKLFADENDEIKQQHSTMLSYIEDCKKIIKELESKNQELESKNQELESKNQALETHNQDLGEKIKKFEMPDRDTTEPCSAIPLVEVCMSCSSRQIILTQVKEQNHRLQKDMQALKDVLYRLNVQLGRYQEKLRHSMRSMALETATDGGHKPCTDGIDSFTTPNLGLKPEAGNTDDGSSKSGRETPADHSTSSTARVVDLSGLLSAQALAPLFDAYQENLQEKENLILDYEKQFETINKRSKQIVEENRSQQEKIRVLEEEGASINKKMKKLVLERDTLEMEKQSLVDRVDKAEGKLKEVYELYEDKMSSMMRDYETVHREYFATKSALAETESKMARMDATLRDKTVPADLHERRVDHCKRLLDELKHQYSMETEKRIVQITKLEEQMKTIEDKYRSTCKELEKAKGDLEEALKNVRLYRKAASIFRQRVRANTVRVNSLRRSCRRRRVRSSEPLRLALGKLGSIKQEIKLVRSRAYSSLEELERRIKYQERRAAEAEAEYRREMDRLHVVIDHKEDIIQRLIDTAASAEIGSIHMSSPEPARQKVKLVPGPGGYYQERRRREKNEHKKETL